MCIQSRRYLQQNKIKYINCMLSKMLCTICYFFHKSKKKQKLKKKKIMLETGIINYNNNKKKAYSMLNAFNKIHQRTLKIKKQHQKLEIFFCVGVVPWSYYCDEQFHLMIISQNNAILLKESYYFHLVFFCVCTHSMLFLFQWLIKKQNLTANAKIKNHVYIIMMTLITCLARYKVELCTFI